jgi:hypothetical protein
MLESITCLIETVKMKCNPVLENAQTDRFNDRFNHSLGKSSGGRSNIDVLAPSPISKKHTVAGRPRRTVALAERDHTRFPDG